MDAAFENLNVTFENLEQAIECADRLRCQQQGLLRVLSHDVCDNTHRWAVVLHFGNLTVRNTLDFPSDLTRWVPGDFLVLHYSSPTLTKNENNEC